MKVGLFIPCYVDQFYPNTAIATLELLEKQGVEVGYITQQTCCGQPMANSGYEHLTGGCNDLFVDNFAGYDYIVSPSGSCALHIKEHLYPYDNEPAAQGIRRKIYELTEFLTNVLKVEKLDAAFPHKVGLHQSCHGQRGLKLAQMTELTASPFSKPVSLLNMVAGVELIYLTPPR
ncbi:heterodisulfide reductase-related iron-sulfur binding cluster [Mucilaginibacter aurantiaciroseus]|uniref:heterodisulfide reductase-related iron-sulfur binding cluster n=1 Tax=Mucilaginibacter aurantiaciroseus TaxID=2949308 RepID=UPI00351790EE